VTVDVAGESVIVVRTKAGELRGFYNVCRHRGSRLCDETSGRMKGAVKCPYHAWAYSFEGQLIGTPNVGRTRSTGMRSASGRWPLRPGRIPVRPPGSRPGPARGCAPRPAGLTACVRTLQPRRPPHRPPNGGGGEANWKILIENYNECLHCPTAHPELIAVVPGFRHGSVYDAHRPDGGMAIAEGGNSFTRTGRSNLPVLPGLSAHDEVSLYGCSVYPNMFLDVSGTGAISTVLLPRDAGHTTVVAEYLFRPEVIADDGFDPSEIVDFTELVAHQGYVVCERVQRGVSSRAFTQGVLAEKDGLLESFNARCLAQRGPVE
jgi:Rieske 2Fe-2S family protein